MSKVYPAIDRLHSWFTGDVLPFWASASWDLEVGGFFECLDLEGAPVRGPRRVRVQARQVYTFSSVASLGWLPQGEEIAARGFQAFRLQSCPDDGARGCAHTLSDDGTITDDRRDLYDQAFLLLACASMIEAGGDKDALALAENTMAFLDRELRSEAGGWFESDRRETPRRQNPHMHLFEAFMALSRATGADAWRRHADAVAALFEERFFNSETGLLREFFTADLAAPDPEHGETIEPGHMMEWVWLLGQYDELTGADHGAVRRQLFSAALNFADKETGLLPDTVTPTGSAVRKRLWPQTEAVRAAFSLSSSPDDDFAHYGARIIEAIFNFYIAPAKRGLWIDQIDDAGEPCVESAPASILYHLFEAVAETQDFARKKRPL
ncbi:MAG: AGE family epimerase/isomerase [Pseudomonadota bacterium]